VQSRVGRVVGGLLTRRGVGFTSLRQDLALTGRTFEAIIGRKVLMALGGFVLTLIVLVTAQISLGAGLPDGAPLVLAAVIAAALFMVPDLEARSTATKRRKDFRRAFGAYLDLVSLEMAGSAAPAEALPQAARVGSGWPLALIRDTLFRATRAGRDPWEALSELGQRIGVPELRDLGQLIQLVAHDGARVRETLTARATTMRRRELADLAGDAGKRDQSMRLAQVLIGVGFIVFIGYPAVINVLNF
jgi:tight adherence protein C